MRRVLEAARRLERQGALTPDSDPAEYVHSIRQWALWSFERKWNEKSFAKEFVQHAKKNIQAAHEPDAAARAKLLEACFAADGRMVTRSTVIRGRAAVDAMIARLHADPNIVGIRMASAVDAVGTTFRFRSFVEMRDGSKTEFFDAGEIDEYGRITTLLVFAGPLAEA